MPRLIILCLVALAAIGCSRPDETQALFSAIQAQDEQAVDRLIQRGRFDIDPPQVPNRVNKPLAYAAAYGNRNIVESLLDAGADIDGQVAYGDVALIKAVEHNNHDIIMLLISRGADVNLPNDFGISAFVGFCAHEPLDIVRLAHEHGGEINASYVSRISGSQGRQTMTALQAAVSYSNAPVIPYLLEQGGEPHLTTASGKDCFELAQDAGNQAVIDLLRPYATDPADAR